MSKITLNSIADITSSSTAQTTINTDLTTIQTAFDNTLSRDGTSPNTMNAGIDMNSNQIVNLPSPTSLNSPARLADVQNLVAGGSITLSPLPTGGTQNQILMKNSSTNYDASWLSNINISGTITTTGTTRNVISSGGALAGNLCIGSNFAAAQPYIFNILDNQAPGNSNFYCFQVGDPTKSFANGSFINAACGSDANPINWNCGAVSVHSASFDTTVSGNSMLGEWHNTSLVKGTGGFLQGVFIQTTTKGTWAPGAGITGNQALSTYSNTTVGGFTFGATIGGAASGTTASNIVGLEIDTQYGVSVGGSKVGLQIADQLNNASGTSTNATINTAFQILRVHNAYGWDTGILFPAGDGVTLDYPVRTTGTLIKSGAGTVTNGIDLSALTISTSAFKSPGFNVDGSGNVTVNSLLHPTAANASVATALSSVGPVGSHTTVQEWFIIKNASGTVRYVPGF